MVSQKMAEHKDECGYKAWQCLDCQFSRKSKWDVQRHVEQKHMGLSISCPHCTATYTRRDKLKCHIKYKHSQNYFE